MGKRRLVDGKLGVNPPNADKGGRPSFLDIDPDITNRMIAAIRIGQSVNGAAHYNNIDTDLIQAWYIKGFKDPNSKYGKFVQAINKAVAEFELRGLAVIDACANGRPSEYHMEPAKNENGTVQLDKNGDPIMVIARDGAGNPMLKRSEVRPDWRAAADVLSKRLPRYWGHKITIDSHDTLTKPSSNDASNETLTFDQMVAIAAKDFDNSL